MPKTLPTAKPHSIGMVCPWCKKAGSKVIDSRLAIAEGIRKRRHRCEHCHRTFATLELTSDDYDTMTAELALAKTELLSTK